MESDKNSIPQWKKDLIARLKNQNKTAAVAAIGSSDHQLYPSPQHSSGRAVQQLNNTTCKSGGSVVASSVSCSSVSGQCNVSSSTCVSVKASKMVQERVWVDNKHEMVNEKNYNNGYHKDSDSDSEDLHYGPGIVKKLKNKYLSLALRESNVRPSILHMRKATSLENLLDDDIPNANSGNRQFVSRLNGNDSRRNPPNRYRNAARGEMKRARSVETISRLDNTGPVISNEPRVIRQSLHEDMLIATKKEGNDYAYRKIQDKPECIVEHKFSNNNTTGQRINRPKRIQPIMNEKEKPPADVVKQAKMIFERQPEQRTRAPPLTGDVAAKVDSFNNIIVKAKVEAKVSKKPQIKHKPVLNDKVKSNTRLATKPVVDKDETKQVQKVPKDLVLRNDYNDTSLPSPIPDVSRIDFHRNGENEYRKNVTSLSETPDLILTSSPLPVVTSPTYKHNSTENFLKEEIRNSSPILETTDQHTLLESPRKVTSPLLSPSKVKSASPLSSPVSPQSLPTSLNFEDDLPDSPGYKKVSPTSIENISKQANDTAVFDFTNKGVNQHHLPVNSNISELKIPPSQPLKIEVNGFNENKPTDSTLLKQQREVPRSPPKFSPAPPPKVLPENRPGNLTATEIEKNLINSVKNLNKQSVNVSKASAEVINKNILVPRKTVPREQASTTVFNFTNRKDVPDYISNDKSRTPSRPELPKPGEGGIILIPGASILDSFTDEDEEILRSLECPPSPCDVMFINDNILIDGKSSLSQKTKRMKLRISFVDDADIYEYPSETSLMLEETIISPVGNTVPSFSGSFLANYTPKGTEEFELGVSRTIQQAIPIKSEQSETELEPETLLQECDKPFSSGTNADILF